MITNGYLNIPVRESSDVEPVGWTDILSRTKNKKRSIFIRENIVHAYNINCMDN